MADIDTSVLEATDSVAEPKASETGKPQGGDAPKLSPLYDQLSEAGKKAIKAERFAPLSKMDHLVAEITRLDGEVGNGIRVPGKDATKEQWAAYRKAMQIPDAPEGYTLQKPQLPNGLPYNDNLEKWFRKELFDAGVPNGSAQKMFDNWNRMQSESFAARQKATTEQAATFAKQALESLQAEYKDAYPQKMESMKAALARYGGVKLLDIIKQARLPNGLTLDNHPDFIRAFVEVGERMNDDSMVPGDRGAGGASAPRPGLPTTPGGFVMTYPGMEKDPRFRVKSE
jgi:hypothetical protein